MNGYKEYYFNIIEKLCDTYIKDKEDTKQILKCYIALADELSMNKILKFYKDHISIDITKQVSMNGILPVINVTVDEKAQSQFNETFTVFHDFF
ncbi:hypothetical protein ACT7C7_05510 [Bacillus cereus]